MGEDDPIEIARRDVLSIEDEEAPLTRDEFLEMLRSDVDDFEAAMKEYADELDEEGNKFPEKMHSQEWFEQFISFLTAAGDEE